MQPLWRRLLGYICLSPIGLLTFYALYLLGSRIVVDPIAIATISIIFLMFIVGGLSMLGAWLIRPDWFKDIDNDYYGPQ